MPSLLRSPLLAVALFAIILGCASSSPARSGELDVQTVVAAPRVSVVHVPKRAPVARRPLGQRAVEIALKAVGVPYRWGGSSPTSGFDCSGLVYWAYGRVGIELPHSSYALYDLGRSVPRNRLEAGDLLFFYELGHVGLYLGGGRMVHAPSSGKHVEIVRLNGSNYGERLVGARRIV
jgi:cell wall-associated NlpC family hydrolase